MLGLAIQKASSYTYCLLSIKMFTSIQLEHSIVGPSPRQETHSLATFRSTNAPRSHSRTVSASIFSLSRQHRTQKSSDSSRRLSKVSAAAETETTAASSAGEQGAKGDEFYEVFLQKPLGVRFGRGNDGGAYVTSTDASKGNVDENIEVGDKLVEVSASFGDDVWEAGNFGQTMYAIKTRNGDLYFKFKKMYGDLSAFEEGQMTEAEKLFKRERSGGNYGGGTKELQMRNFQKRKEAEAKRKDLFNSGLDKFNKGDIKGALYDFEEVIAMEQKQPQTPRDFALVTSLFRVSHYNIACCYAALDEIEAGLEALDISMQAGFDQYGKIRTDVNLDKLRRSPKFKQLIERYDEPVLDTNIFKSFSGLFGGKKD